MSLIINVPISRDFKDGEKHFYMVTARENEFIEIVCERKGVDIGLAAFAPGGEKLSTSNAPGGFAGRDNLAFIGLTHGFIYAGASSVVSSLWKVEDAATAELMKRFYRAMLKENQTPSAALRIAQNEMRPIPRFRNPNNWAGFMLTGEWQ